ncbi:MAG: hypothetical protein LBS03_09305 [Bacteroidales bacterium]|jgi:major membrane immunogen (membrane-anchored lipoprotein)|nr:hypothetical protein [Bacteroidales bacterium]
MARKEKIMSKIMKTTGQGGKISGKLLASIAAVAAVLVLGLVLLTGCGQNGNDSGTNGNGASQNGGNAQTTWSETEKITGQETKDGITVDYTMWYGKFVAGNAKHPGSNESMYRIAGRASEAFMVPFSAHLTNGSDSPYKVYTYVKNSVTGTGGIQPLYIAIVGSGYAEPIEKDNWTHYIDDITVQPGESIDVIGYYSVLIDNPNLLSVGVKVGASLGTKISFGAEYFGPADNNDIESVIAPKAK